MSYSYKSIIDGGADSDLIYYNASIIATKQNGAAPDPSQPPIVRFNETRDAPIIKDASKYYFSIIRFAMNGPNKNLPIFIPIIQTNNVDYPAQIDPNLTIYYTTIAYQREWYYTNTAGATATKVFTATPQSTHVPYVSETQNAQQAPIPSSGPLGFTKQDLSSRYYWVYTYKHWTNLVNFALQTAMSTVYDEFKFIWNNDADIASAFPYPTLKDFIDDHDVPFIKYNEETKLFEIYGDTRAFNVSGPLTGLVGPLGGFGTQSPVPAFVPPAVPAPGSPAIAASEPYLRLFFNNNLYGLFANFNNTYLNAFKGTSINFPLTGSTLINPVNLVTTEPVLYTNEILFTNQEYTNILNNNPLLQGLNAVPPPAYNPYFLIPTEKQNLYWIARQDFNSTNSLWSPVQSIIFTSTMIPLKKEYNSAPVQLGDSNAFSSTGSRPAFEPIISDFVIDAQQEKAEGWRDFTLYEPTAEYKMVSLNASHDEIRNIDIQVYWKYRLTGELIPLTMFNCSDVSIKMLFRRIDYRS